jgi:hypothetical protein
MAAVEKRDVYSPLSFEVGGPSVLFLVLDVFIYWGIIILYEKKILQRMFRRNNNNQNQDAQDSFLENQVDEDIIEEE